MSLPTSKPMSSSVSCILNNMVKAKDWFRPKKYPHIGLPLTEKDRTWVTKYVTDAEKIKRHAFFPFIHRSSLKRKFRKTIDKTTGKRSILRVATTKRRELYYANHLDSNIYSYYASKLSESYDEHLTKLGINDVVTAYRRIKVDPLDEASSHKSSVDFASEIFNYIISHTSEKLVAVTFDIKSFFDELDHGLLKKSWYNLRNIQKSLPDDEYNLYKNIINYSYVNENELFKEFSNEIIIRKKSGLQKKVAVKRMHHFKNKGVVAYCEKEDFVNRIRKKNLIIGNNEEKVKRRMGIPQGSPISSVLANIYMLPFDQKVNSQVSHWQGLYRRYSDDMIVVCEEIHLKDLIKLFDEVITERKLIIQHDKTQIFRFTNDGIRYNCAQQYESTLHPNKNLEYLGFEFDGYNTMLKSASLSSFYRKMKRGYNRSYFYSQTSKAPKSKGQIFKTRLYKKYTYKGAGRKRIYKIDKTDPTIWHKTNFYNWGNYLSYAKLSAAKLPNNKIRNQVKKHWKILNKLINV